MMAEKGNKYYKEDSYALLSDIKKMIEAGFVLVTIVVNR